MRKNDRPLVAITMGDPAGIGAEVAVKALSDISVYQRCSPFIVGNVDAIRDAQRFVGNCAKVTRIRSLGNLNGDANTVEVFDPGNLDYSKIRLGRLSPAAGKASVEWVIEASKMAASARVQAIVTAPINKEACSLAGYEDIGHMELLQRHTGVKNVATMLIADGLRVVHLTTHKSMREACNLVTKSNVTAAILLTAEHFKKWGFPSPRIGVAALNPHAGDGGLIGDEEKREIGPAVAEARIRNIQVVGPIPADTIFNQAIEGKYDVVLAMYHDQGHIPIKVHNWAKSITLNIGLPFIRTSVDHGTAFDIAGMGVAEHESMSEAIRVAVDLASEGKLK